jgi:hypothetical protein
MPGSRFREYPVNHRARRLKTDRIAALALLRPDRDRPRRARRLRRLSSTGVEEEDARHVAPIGNASAWPERIGHFNHIKGLLWTCIKRRNLSEPGGELAIAPLAFPNPDDDEGRY